MACVAAVAPAKANAVRECSIDVGARVTIDGKEAYFLPGIEANIRMKEIAGTDTSTDGYKTIDTNILAIKKSNTEPSSENKTANNIVSTDESSYPIYMWLDNGDLFWWSEDKTPNMNEDSQRMFNAMTNMADISGVADFDSGEVTNMQLIFSTPGPLLPLETQTLMSISSLKPLSKWNTAKVVDMSWAFSMQRGLTTLEGLENWDVSNVETLFVTFGYSPNLASLEALSNWNISSVNDIRYIFIDDISLEDLKGLENWNTSGVTTMFGAFMLDSKVDYAKAKLSDIGAIKDWDVSRVTNMQAMLQKQAAITSLDSLKSWNVSSVEVFRNFCALCHKLDDVSVFNDWRMSGATDISLMFDQTAVKEIDLSSFDFSQIAVTSKTNLIPDCTSLERLKTPKIYPTDSAVKIKLPVTMYDADGNAYTQLDNTSPTEIWLTSTAP